MHRIGHRDLQKVIYLEILPNVFEIIIKYL